MDAELVLWTVGKERATVVGQSGLSFLIDSRIDSATACAVCGGSLAGARD
jgi:hypothetical protein